MGTNATIRSLIGAPEIVRHDVKDVDNFETGEILVYTHVDKYGSLALK